jgi:hypothetical protein
MKASCPPCPRSEVEIGKSAGVKARKTNPANELVQASLESAIKYLVPHGHEPKGYVDEYWSKLLLANGVTKRIAYLSELQKLNARTQNTIVKQLVDWLADCSGPITTCNDTVSIFRGNIDKLFVRESLPNKLEGKTPDALARMIYGEKGMYLPDDEFYPLVAEIFDTPLIMITTGGKDDSSCKFFIYLPDGSRLAVEEFCDSLLRGDKFKKRFNPFLSYVQILENKGTIFTGTTALLKTANQEMRKTILFNNVLSNFAHGNSAAVLCTPYHCVPAKFNFGWS